MISSLCVHHLPDERKQRLFREIFERLVPGGWYLNLDPVTAADPAVDAVWQRVNDRRDPLRPASGANRTPHEQLRYQNHVRYMIPLAAQVDFLCAAERLASRRAAGPANRQKGGADRRQRSAEDGSGVRPGYGIAPGFGQAGHCNHGQQVLHDAPGYFDAGRHGATRYVNCMTQQTTRRIGILGSGAVGLSLAQGFQDLGHHVTMGSRAGKDITGWSGAVGNFRAAAAAADLVAVALKGAAAESVVASVKAELAGKTVIDTTNPIAEQPPEDGVLKFFTGLDESLMERLQRAAPEAHFVKAFNSVGSALIIHPHFKDGPPTMFICGQDPRAKAEVTALLDQFGWDVEDLGGPAAARAIEPLCMLWCIPGLRENRWNHAFKLLRS